MNHIPESDAYRTLAAPAKAEIKILGSRFLGFAWPVTSTETFQRILQELKTSHYDATHHCFAYRLGFDGVEFRYSDDGEPSGSAGKRILGSIDREQLTDTGIIIIRYFGGTKLGVGGLARAYSEAADAVLAVAPIVQRFQMKRFRIQFPYDATHSVHHDIDVYGVEVFDRIYAEDVVYDVQVRVSRYAPFRSDLAEHTQRMVVFLPDEADSSD